MSSLSHFRKTKVYDFKVFWSSEKMMMKLEKKETLVSLFFLYY